MTIFTRCAGCYRAFDPPREVEGVISPKDVKDYFCSEECLDNEIDRQVEPDFKANASPFDSENFQRTYRLWVRNEKEEDQELERWFKDKETARRWAAHEIKQKLDAERSQEAARKSEQRQKEWEMESRHRREKTLGEIKILQIEMKIAQQEREARVEAVYEQAHLENQSRDLEALLQPRDIPDGIRFEHTHILGPQGSGKTTLLQQILLDDLKKPDPPAYIIIDPKGLLVERIAHLDFFHPSHGRLRDRLVIIDPSKAPALNMFDQQVRPEVLNRLIELFGYVFSSANAKITQRQSVPFGFVVRLVFWLRGDLNTLMDVLEDDHKIKKFAPQIDLFCSQDPTGAARRFFTNDFYTSNFAPTREQIRTRLFEIVARPELAAMFLAPTNKLNILDCIQQKKIILVNTADSFLGTEQSRFLGRYIIAMAVNAALSRFFLPKDQWTPAYLMIDEFQEFADEEHTPKLLRMVREYRMGVVMAHQQMHCPEFSEAIRNAVSSSAIKYAASPEAADLAYMARDLRCEPDFLRKQEVSNGEAHFACFVRGLNLQHPFQISVPVKNLEREPQMPSDAYEQLLSDNEQQLTASQTHDPAEAGSRAMESLPVEADTPVVLPPQIDRPAIGTHTETGEDW